MYLKYINPLSKLPCNPARVHGYNLKHGDLKGGMHPWQLKFSELWLPFTHNFGQCKTIKASVPRIVAYYHHSSKHCGSCLFFPTLYYFHIFLSLGDYENLHNNKPMGLCIAVWTRERFQVPCFQEAYLNHNKII